MSNTISKNLQSGPLNLDQEYKAPTWAERCNNRVYTPIEEKRGDNRFLISVLEYSQVPEAERTLIMKIKNLFNSFLCLFIWNKKVKTERLNEKYNALKAVVVRSNVGRSFSVEMLGVPRQVTYVNPDSRVMSFIIEPLKFQNSSKEIVFKTLRHGISLKAAECYRDRITDSIQFASENAHKFASDPTVVPADKTGKPAVTESWSDYMSRFTPKPLKSLWNRLPTIW